MKRYLSQSLPPETFHVTIHDLNNPLDTPENLPQRMEETRKVVKEIFRNLESYKNKKIHLKAVGIIGIPTAVGIGFEPISERDFKVLLEIHRAFHKIRHIERYIPHVTLGYFKPVNFKTREISEIASALKIITKASRKLQITLEVKDLSYQVFDDMRSYHTIFKLEDILK